MIFDSLIKFKFVRTIIAIFHLNDKIVCEESSKLKDYHDFKDANIIVPFHDEIYICKRCCKRFKI